MQVLTPDRSTEIGTIRKQWSGLARELYTDADNFSITFPLSLDVRAKAILLGAVFLIDFMYFENSGGRVKDSYTLGQILDD